MFPSFLHCPTSCRLALATTPPPRSCPPSQGPRTHSQLMDELTYEMGHNPKLEEVSDSSVPPQYLLPGWQGADAQLSAEPQCV